MSEFEAFVARRQDVPNKVVLFTKKKKTTALFKGLTSEYRDRLEVRSIIAHQKFAEVHESAAEIRNEYKIEKYPSLAVFRKNESGTAVPEIFTGKLSFNNIADWLDGLSLIHI